MFQRKKRKEQAPPSLQPENKVKSLRKTILLRSAAYLNRKWQSLPPRRQRLGLILLLLVMSALSLFNMKEAFKGKRKYSYAIIEPIQIPKYWSAKDSIINSDSILTKEQYNRLLSYEKLLDSLGERGKGSPDSLVRVHSDLRDSIALLRKIYEERVNQLFIRK